MAVRCARAPPRAPPHDDPLCRFTPPIFKWLLDTIVAKDGHGTEGLFRVSAQLYALQQLRASLEGRGLEATAASADELVPSVHVAAATLKAWLRELPAPLLPVDVYDTCMAAGDAKDAAFAIRIARELPPANKTVLFALLT